MKITDSQQLVQLLTQYAKEALSVGDRFTGRILAITDGLLSLQLPDGSKVSAEVKSQVEYSQGQVLRLEVVEEKEGRLFVKEVAANQVQPEDKLLEPAGILKALRLPVDAQRVEIVKAMADLGVKPSSEIIEKAVQLLSEQQIAEPKQAVFLLLNKMENNKDYFPLVKQLNEQSFHFQNKLQSLANSITQLDENTVLTLAEALVTEDILQKQDMSVIARQITSLFNSGAAPVSEKALAGGLKAVLQEMLALPDETAQSPQTEGMTQLPAKTNQFSEIQKLLNHHLPGFEKAEPPIQNEIIKTLSALEGKINREKPALTPEKAVQVILQTAREELSGTSVRTSEAGLPKVDQWLAQTERKLQVLSQVLTKTQGTEVERLLPELRELQTAVSFFNDVTSYEAFVQIPLVLRDNTTEGELYVMKRKGPRKLNAEDFSLFLSLSTLNLGTIDTFVHVQKKNIMLRVMVEDERFHAILTNEYKALHEALKAKGYTLYELKVAPRGEGLDIVNAMKKAREITEPNKKIDIKV